MQSDRDAARRRAIVAAVRQGQSQHATARQFHVSQSTVQHWVRHAQGQRLDRLDWHDRPHTPKAPHRAEAVIEDLVLTVRAELKQVSDLGFQGAETIHEALKVRMIDPLPAARTIHRILERRGVLDGRRRIRRPAPPPGWHPPEVASKRQELDSVDVVEGPVITGGPQVEVLNGISLHGGLAASWPMEASVTAESGVASLIGHWRVFGLPGYARCDNDTIIQGAHAHPEVIGRVSRLCLSLGVTPVFVVPHEFGFQSMIENCNGAWQAKVWARFEHGAVPGLQGHSQRYVTALLCDATEPLASSRPLRGVPSQPTGGRARGPGLGARSSTRDGPVRWGRWR